MNDPERGLILSSQQVAIVDPMTTDDQVIAMWLHGKSSHTQRAYILDVTQFREHVLGKPLHQVTLIDVQSFSDLLAVSVPGRQRRAVAAVKSLFTFARQIGYLRFNPAAPVRIPRKSLGLAGRMLTEGQVSRMIALEPGLRNRLLLKVLYTTGCRVAELVALSWDDIEERGEAGQVTITGKGEKVRTVLLPLHLWEELSSWRGEAGFDQPLFESRKGGGHLDPSQVRRIVRQAARRAEIDKPVSPHWFRHAHACHALERGCPLHLLQASLGHANLSVTGMYLHARPTDCSSRYLIQL